MSNLKSWMFALPAFALLAFALRATGATPDAAELTYHYSADVLDSSLRSDTLQLLGNVRFVQGPMSIEAQQATASAFRSENSRWQFQDSVRVRTDNAELASESASAAFEDGELAGARVEGSPARFEQLGGTQERSITGRAQVIEYDVIGDIVTFTGDVWFSYGKDEFRGDTVIYDMQDERVRVNPGSTAPGRVRGIIRPRAGSTETESRSPIGPEQAGPDDDTVDAESQTSENGA